MYPRTLNPIHASTHRVDTASTNANHIVPQVLKQAGGDPAAAVEAEQRNFESRFVVLDAHRDHESYWVNDTHTCTKASKPQMPPRPHLCRPRKQSKKGSVNNTLQKARQLEGRRIFVLDSSMPRPRSAISLPKCQRRVGPLLQ